MSQVRCPSAVESPPSSSMTSRAAAEEIRASPSHCPSAPRRIPPLPATSPRSWPGIASGAIAFANASGTLSNE
jgi:hypothetical protein